MEILGNKLFKSHCIFHKKERIKFVLNIYLVVFCLFCLKWSVNMGSDLLLSQVLPVNLYFPRLITSMEDLQHNLHRNMKPGLRSWITELSFLVLHPDENSVITNHSQPACRRLLSTLLLQ